MSTKECKGSEDDELLLNSAPSIHLITYDEIATSSRPYFIVDVGISPSSSLVPPGTIRVNLSEVDVMLEDEDGNPLDVYGNYNLKSPPEVRKALEKAGIDFKTRVVVLTSCQKEGYSDLVVPCRFAWILLLCGVKNVYILNGKFPQTSKHVVPRIPVSSFFCGLSSKFPLHPEFLSTTLDVERLVSKIPSLSHYKSDVSKMPSLSHSFTAKKATILADVRSLNEFLAIKHDYPYEMSLGRIPGSVWCGWGPSTYIGGDFYDLETSRYDLDHVRKLWKQLGILSSSSLEEDTSIIFYCGSGYRSAMAFCLARILGIEHVSSYDGGWLEWHRLHPRARSHGILK